MAQYSYRIRSAEPSDAEGLWKCFTSPLVVRNTLQIPFRSLESIKQHLANPGEGNYQLVAEADGEIVGCLGLHTTTRPRLKHKADFGMNVRDDWQGKGIGSALMAAMIDLADNWLNLTRLELTVYTDNDAAVALYKKFGFEIEGTLRKFAFREGAFVDAHTMARIR